MFCLLVVMLFTVGLSVQKPQEPLVLSIVERPANADVKGDSVYQNVNTYLPSREKKFYLNVNSKINWFQAMHLCHSLKMKFATVGSEQELNMLIGVIKEANIGPTGFWLSASDLGNTGTYTWASYGTPMNYIISQYGNFTHETHDGEVEHCVEISSNTSYKMTDSLCSQKKFSVCEYYDVKRDSIMYEHLNPNSPTREKRFHLGIISKVNWYQAMHLCHSINMKFASTNNQQEFDKVIELIKQTNINPVSFWLSGSDLGDYGTYVWASYGSPMTYTKWQPGDPNHDKRNGEVEHCVETSSYISFTMNDDPCSVEKFYVCEYYT